jgi:ribosomal protein S18 acetylase RimI-like enzyme
MLTVRSVESADLPVVWAMAVLPNVGATADPSVPVPLPPARGAPLEFGDLADPAATFGAVGGDFVVADLDGHVVGMGGFRPSSVPGRAEVLRLRVHPARRRHGIGRALMAVLESRAAACGFGEAWLDTATNQPEAVAFYESLGYAEVARESRPEWHWTLVYYVKRLPH